MTFPVSAELAARLLRSETRATTAAQMAAMLPQDQLATMLRPPAPILLRYPDEVVIDGAVAYWRLGESAGTAAADTTGNGRAGVLSGAVVLGTAGALVANMPADLDTAATFTGGQLSVAHHSSLSFDAEQDFSLEWWLRSTQSAGFPASVVDKSAGGVFPYRLRLVSGGAIEAARSDGTSTPALTSAPLTDDAWHYVVFFKSGATLGLHVDAGPATTVADTTTAAGTTVPLVIGSAALAASLDEVAVYPSALSADLRSRHWNAGLGVAV